MANDATAIAQYVIQGPGRTRAQLLKELEGLPDDSYVSTRHAAAIVGTSPEQMNNWRYQRKGPPFSNLGYFVRYKIGDVKKWLAGGAGTDHV